VWLWQRLLFVFVFSKNWQSLDAMHRRSEEAEEEEAKKETALAI
jgi:hypothetical protein